MRQRLVRILLWAASIVVAVVAAVLLVGAFSSRSLPDLRPWHTVPLTEEYRAGDDAIRSFHDYRALEDRLFREMADKIHHEDPSSDDVALDRYDPRSPSYPPRFATQWNRSIELRPETIRGGALLVHGLTDSPYSVRAVAERLRDLGYYVLAPRMPGHGTTPKGLADAQREDWTAVVRLAARHVREVVGPDAEFLVGGYSNGGTLAVQYTLDELRSEDIGAPDRLVLLSPSIGVSRFAAFASWHRLLSAIPYFEKFRWDSVRPEFDPFKYNSFPYDAGHEVWELTGVVKKRLRRAASDGVLDRMPPILTFQSLVDSTVLTEAIVVDLYDRLPANGHELVLFDYNRWRPLRQYLRPVHERMLQRFGSDEPLSYGITLVTNDGTGSREVAERRRPAGGAVAPDVPLGLSWPLQVYSLSHVAIPFSQGDPLYGDGVTDPDPLGPRLGSLRPRGESGVLIVPVGQFMRLRHNPFFPYQERRLIAWLGGDPAGGVPRGGEVGYSGVSIPGEARADQDKGEEAK